MLQSIPAPLLAALSPETKHMMQADLNRVTKSGGSPASMQPSPAPPLFQDDQSQSRLFGKELDTTNISISALKRPAESHQQSLEPPSKKMNCAPYAYDDHHHGDGHGSQHIEEKIGVTVDGYDLSSAAFPPVPSSKPIINERSLEAVLEPVNSKKRDDISKFLSDDHSKEFDTKVDYDSRVRECKTLGRALIGSWCGKTSGDGVTWIHHPVYDFNLWLRIDANEESLWTCDRGGKWKQNVHAELFPGPALELYKKLWKDKKFLQVYNGRMDPRINKRAFEPVLADHLSFGRGEAQFKTCFAKFWESNLRKETHTKKSKPKTMEELVAIGDRAMQQQAPGIHLHSGAQSFASGATCNINYNYHYPSSTFEAARAPAPPPPPPDQL